MNHGKSYEETLWSALKQGDKEAFGELYELYYRALYGYGIKVLNDVELVEDAVQDLFVNLWHTRQNLADVSAVKFYLFRALRRDIYRQSKTEKRFSPMEEAGSFADHSEAYIFEQREQEKRLTLKLTQMLRRLPERQLEVVQLRFYENFKTEEIALIMGISEKSVRNTLYKALTHLREYNHYLAPFLELLFLAVLSATHLV